MKKILLLLCLVGLTTACSRHESSIYSQKSRLLTYDELYNYPRDCAKQHEQVTELNNILMAKRFNTDPDELDEADHDYNARLKATLWWYVYACN